MAILLGDIALTRLQRVLADEPRNLVELRGPGAKGSVFQDLGRNSQRLRLQGVFLGEEALREIEVLRKAHADATPLSFSADIAVGSEITDVVIERFEVRQVPGHRFRYEYLLQVCEWIEPAAPAGADLVDVDVAVAADADRWATEGSALAAGLTDPSALAATLRGRPGLLARIDTRELAKAVVGALGGLDAKDFAHLLGAVSSIDPDRVIELIDALGEVEGPEDLLSLVFEEGISVAEALTGVDVSSLTSFGRALVGGSDFIAKARDVVGATTDLLEALADFDPGATFEAMEGGSP